MMVFPAAMGEITPTVVAFLLGIAIGTQFVARLSRRTTLLILVMSVVAAFLFEAPIHTWSLLGGVLAEHVSFALPFISATIGLLVGSVLRGSRRLE
ncbi:MAG: hypothetical protein Metus_0896 [Candidatus Methanosuratincola subterraneus]|jgi:hypothetical protein|uniref:Uncharacterized protein n=2 Tax=Candidatus Methanosuratincola (ex Vanwonterghem et al. 2016) TaxID=1915412 RepID=A0A7J3UZR0_9CREN|nr:MAG: hypothetical protein Metus_0896 [Candidatus Methanosuratincola subterraneus]